MSTKPPTADLPAVAVQWDGDEPFIVPPGNTSLRLTPYRDTEAEVAGLISLCNHPDVGKWSHGRPYPFTGASARTRLDNNLPKQAEAVAALRADPDARLTTLPFSVIRTAGRSYVGDVIVRPLDGDNWAAAYAVHPDFQSRGVGTAAVAAVLGWAKGMGAKTFEITIETRNPASSRLAEKLGFTVAKTEMVDWPEQHGGGQREVATWVRDA